MSMTGVTHDGRVDVPQQVLVLAPGAGGCVIGVLQDGARKVVCPVDAVLYAVIMAGRRWEGRGRFGEQTFIASEPAS